MRDCVRVILCTAAGMYQAAEVLESSGVLTSTSFMIISQTDSIVSEIRNVLCNIFPKVAPRKRMGRSQTTSSSQSENYIGGRTSAGCLYRPGSSLRRSERRQKQGHGWPAFWDSVPR